MSNALVAAAQHVQASSAQCLDRFVLRLKLEMVRLHPNIVALMVGYVCLSGARARDEALMDEFSHCAGQGGITCSKYARWMRRPSLPQGQFSSRVPPRTACRRRVFRMRARHVHGHDALTRIPNLVPTHVLPYPSDTNFRYLPPNLHGCRRLLASYFPHSSHIRASTARCSRPSSTKAR